MLDVHVLVTHRLPQGWLEQSIGSVFAAARAAPFEVNVHLSPESKEDFWRARWDGYARGSAPWATYVDADDWVEEDAFALLQPHLDGGDATILTGGIAHELSTGRALRTGLGMKVHTRSMIDAADKEAREACCPSCMMLRSSRVIRIEEAPYHRRVGYRSLGSEWRDQNGMA